MDTKVDGKRGRWTGDGDVRFGDRGRKGEGTRCGVGGRKQNNNSAGGRLETYWEGDWTRGLNRGERESERGREG